MTPVDSGRADGRVRRMESPAERAATGRPTCGYRAECGRVVRHRGLHGDWRSGVVARAASPVEREPAAGYVADLPPRALEVLSEVLVHGSFEGAASCIGISYASVRGHLWTLRQRTGAVSSFDLAYILGWITFPAWLQRDHGKR